MSEREMGDLIDLLERKLGRSWSDIVHWLQQENGLEEISAQLSTGDWTTVLDSVRTAAERFATDIHAGYVDAGRETAKWLDSQIDGIVRFDVANPTAARWAEQNSLSLVRGLTDEARQTIHQVLVDGHRAGENPLDIARDIRSSLGLTPSQAQVVANYRRLLESGQYSDALNRELSDGRYDRSLQAAQRDGRTLSDEQIDRMVDRYRQNYISYRAETLARTESLRVTHQGNEEALRQAIDRGDIDAAELVREWHHTAAGKHPRREHAAMDGQTRPWGVPFQSGSGALLRFPCDPEADPSETINCRCAISTTIA